MAENKKVLIVDDDKLNVITLAHYLKPPYDVTIALDGASAIKAAEKHKPDLILLDIIMPDINGFDVLVKLRESPATMNIPIIFITALDTDKIMEKGLSLGAVDYIIKPYEKSVVKEKIDAYLKSEG